MNTFFTLSCLIVSLLVSSAAVGKTPATGAHGPVVLDGISVTAWWNDGDSFTARRVRGEKPARVVGYNTLETHGAVHQWGDWTAAELLELSHRATQLAASKERHCTSKGIPDRYGRPLVQCPDAARELVGAGLAMVFAVNEAPDQELVRLQAAAQAQRKGMWARGIPRSIVTSVHSLDEKDNRHEGLFRDQTKGVAYNRLTDTRTGQTNLRPHREVFRPCQVVCEGQGNDPSCLTYVPFGHRRRDQPDCLRGR